MAEAFLRSPFSAVEKTTLQAEVGSEVSERSLNRLADLHMHSRMLWVVCRIETHRPTEEVFDLLWVPMLAKGHRRLSVRRGSDQDAVMALIHKADQAKVDLGTLPEGVRPTALFEVLKPGRGLAGARAIEDFARAWLKDYSEITSNFEVVAQEEEEDVPTVEQIYRDVAPLSNREFLSLKAEEKLRKRRAPVVTIAPELNSLRALDRKEAKAAADLLLNPCYRPVNVEDKDFLHMPTDFFGVDDWVGETWDPETKCKRSMTYLHYLNSEEHLERTAVVYSDSGSGKTPALTATAGSFAMRYQKTDAPYYLYAGTAFGLKESYKRGLVTKGVPRVIEDFKPQRQGKWGAKRQPFEEFLVNLLNVKDGGTIDTPGGMQMAFPPNTPQLISTNRKFDQWIQDFKKFPAELQHAISKRIVFFTVPDTPLVKGELRKRKREDERSAVEEGLLREREFLRQRGRTDFDAQLISTTASGSCSPAGTGDPSPSETVDSEASSESSDAEGPHSLSPDPVVRKCLHCQRNLPRSRPKGAAMCKGCKLCPPGGNKGWRREQGRIDFAAVLDIAQEACAGNKWIKKEQLEHVSDFIAHLVTASYAKPANAGRTPIGYDFLPVEFPHPNGDTRKRTHIAKEIVETLGPEVQHQIFGIILWRYHNTEKAWAHLKPLMQKFCADEDMDSLRQGVAAMYHADGPTKAQIRSHLFSGRKEDRDAIRSSGGHGSWRKAVENSLETWWQAALHAGAILRDPATTPAIWHQRFLKEIIKELPCFGPYWSKYPFGDIGQQIAPEVVDLENYTMIGNGCEDWLRIMGLQFRDAQREGLEIVRELKEVVNKVLESGLHSGLQRAREEMRLRPLTAYDVQVQSCGCKKGLKKRS